MRLEPLASTRQHTQSQPTDQRAMLISEIYQSRQGEGLLTGTPSVFVRTSGCNLRCGFCDTPFASWEPEGRQLSIPEILAEIEACADGAQHVVMTGGEPMLPKAIEELSGILAERGFHCTIETAGTIYRELPCDLMSISPKFSNSDPELGRAGEWRAKHQAARNRLDVVAKLIDQYPFQLKFVVDTIADLDEIEVYLGRLGELDSKRVLLMPQGVTQAELEQRAEWLEPVCEQRAFTFCPRKHIEWYGNRRGT
ncbi:MAG: 7-carboxy-7-deazaguanine synthase [Mariniblastus sp.]|jgi:7-carboxy-7-deazaguanine synthase